MHYLSVLDLSPGATLDEMRQAYRDLVKVWHPDRFPASEARLRAAAEKKLRELNAAYTWLSERIGAIAAANAADRSVLVRCPVCLEPNHLPYPLGDEPHRCPECGSAFRAQLKPTNEIELQITDVGRRPTEVWTPPAARPAPDTRPALHQAKKWLLAAAVAGAVAAAAALVWLRPQPPGVPSSFTIGSTREQVLAAQGNPTAVVGDSWRYGFSFVTFADGRVVGYANISRNLRVRMGGETAGSSSRGFAVGSSRDEVLAAQGTPSAVIGDTWQYDSSRVEFDGDHVRRYADDAGKLHLRR